MSTVAIAPTNIAIVKYWGKNPKFEKYNIPTKSSLSFTVDKLYTKTKLEMEEGNGSIKFILNGSEVDKNSPKYAYINKFMNNVCEIIPELKEYNYLIDSKNNFPTAAGFASSASGFAALAKAIQGELKQKNQTIYEKFMSNDKKLSVFARLGSGSAARSIPSTGGVVLWHKGNESDPMFSSYAESIFPVDHWPEIRIIYVAVESHEKKIKSRKGMKMTVKTNPIYMNWVEYEENNAIPLIKKAISEKNFELLANEIMQCSNGLHAMMLYTQPRISYLNDTSQDIIEYILQKNENEVTAAYTFDAGPNAVIITTKEYSNELKSDMYQFGDVTETKVGMGARYE